MVNLSVNLNKIALLRNQRSVGYPSVTEMARCAIAAGAQGITIHPRPDERHIRRSDAYRLSSVIRDEYGSRVEFNIEGNPTPEFLALVAEARPDQVTLVPDLPDASTSDHGWDLVGNRAFLVDVIGTLRAQGLRVSLFVDTDPETVPLAKEVGADRVELYTGPYAESFGTPHERQGRERCLAAGRAARDAGLGLNAGHDLNLENLPPLVKGLPWLQEVSIGHALTADALMLGYYEAVRAYLRVLSGAPRPHEIFYPTSELDRLPVGA